MHITRATCLVGLPSNRPRTILESMWSYQPSTKCSPKRQTRTLSIHEYQAKDMLRKEGVMLARERLAHTAEEAERIVKDIGNPCFLKSQILSGGRGKGVFDNGLEGGIQLAKSDQDAKNIASRMFNAHLRTNQTPNQGLLVDKLLVSEKVGYEQEYYLAIAIDRKSCSPVLIVSQQGGVDIEQITASSPDSLLRWPIKYSEGITSDMIQEISEKLSLDDTSRDEMLNLLTKLYGVFKAKDATLLEINPRVRTKAGQFLCLDAKFNIDNAAVKRQPEIFQLRDRSQERPDELEAEKSGLVYVHMDGNIGNVVNGAGLAMATNDAIALYGGKSANFLDAGGQATTETMVKAFEIILKDDRVKVILVNIYGGIIRCDMIAESIIQAAAKIGPLRCPVIVRLQGTNAEEGQKMVAESGLDLIAEADFGSAARRAVEEAAARS